MTTTPMMQSGPVPADRSRRLIPITADLLPTEIVEHRRGRAARKIVVAGLAGWLALFGGWYGITLYQTVSARTSLATAEDDVSHLKAQKSRYADVLNAQAESQRINTALATLMADDLQWSKLIGALRSTEPSGINLTGVSGKVGATATGSGTGTGGGSKTAVQLPDRSGHKMIGQLTITGNASSKAALATYSDALDKVTGLTRVLVTSSTLANGSESFTVRADLTNQILGGRYTPTTSSGSGAK